MKNRLVIRKSPYFKQHNVGYVKHCVIQSTMEPGGSLSLQSQ